MRRIGNLFEEFCSFKNLLIAYQKARKGSRHNQEYHAFNFHLETDILQLCKELKQQSYHPSPFRYFQILDPKERIISVAPFKDRVVHHALINVLEPVFEACFIYDSYATRKEKGTHKAIKRAQHFLQKNNWFFKTDIDKYFNSIDHDILLKIIKRKIKDEQILSITAKIIQNGGKDGKGLPIGNLTSQFFANVYLNPLDHYIKEDLGCKHYLRYMDDFVLFSPEKEELKSWRNEIKSYLENNLNLCLKKKATFINQRSNGLSFLGARIYPALIRIHSVNGRRIQRRLIKKTKAYKAGRLSEDAWRDSLQSSWAYLETFDALALRRKLVTFIEGYIA